MQGDIAEMLGEMLWPVDIIWIVKSEKSKPVEKRGRKAKGLKLRSAVMTARLPKMK
jgi:hypothetical protein